MTLARPHRVLSRRHHEPRPDRSTRWFLLAVLAAFVLRLAWVTWATRSTMDPLTDTGRYLTAARHLADGDLPTRNGTPSAADAIGYPLLLTPTLWFSRAL